MGISGHRFRNRIGVYFEEYREQGSVGHTGAIERKKYPAPAL
jgi:hypothetical protein